MTSSATTTHARNIAMLLTRRIAIPDVTMMKRRLKFTSHDFLALRRVAKLRVPLLAHLVVLFHTWMTQGGRNKGGVEAFTPRMDIPMIISSRFAVQVCYVQKES